MKEWFVYILSCNDGTLYTGVSKDVHKRIACHNSGKGAKYTRSRLPVNLFHSEGPMSKTDALRRELEIKRMNRIEKMRLKEE